MPLIDHAWIQEAELNQQNQKDYQYGATTKRVPDDAPYQSYPQQYVTYPQRAPHDAPAQYGTTAHQRAPPQVKYLLFMDALQDEPHNLPSPP